MAKPERNLKRTAYAVLAVIVLLFIIGTFYKAADDGDPAAPSEPALTETNA